MRTGVRWGARLGYTEATRSRNVSNRGGGLEVARAPGGQRHIVKYTCGRRGCAKPVRDAVACGVTRFGMRETDMGGLQNFSQRRIRGESTDAGQTPRVRVRREAFV